MSTKLYDPVVINLADAAWQPWTKPGAVGSVKLFTSNGKRLRLLQLPAGFDELNWCTVGHQGYVFEGSFTIVFDDGEYRCDPGMAFSIPDGIRHRSRGASESKTLVFVVDDMVS